MDTLMSTETSADTTDDRKHEIPIEKKTIISVIDDDQEVITSLIWLIESVGYEVKTYNSAEAFLQTPGFTETDCLITDVRMPKMSGLELQEELKQRGIDIPIIFMTGHGDVPMAVRAMKSNATDFMTKPVNYQILLEVINKAIKESKKLQKKLAKRQEIIERTQRLTPREHEIMNLMMMGKLTKNIADSLSISPNTAEVHRAKIMKKMEVKTLAELIFMALKYDLVGIDEVVSLP